MRIYACNISRLIGTKNHTEKVEIIVDQNHVIVMKPEQQQKQRFFFQNSLLILVINDLILERIEINR